jgi:type IV fimbrial biogenesis protein FimT
MKRAFKGVALVELIIVLAIAAVLIGLASPSMRGLILRYRLDAAVGDLFGAIDLTRAQAIARGARVLLVPLDPGGLNWSSGWIVFVDTDGDRRPGPREQVIASHGPLDEDITTTFIFTGGHTPYYIAYNGAGRSCSHTSSTAARWGTLSLHQDGQIRRIRINMLGRARVCNPEREPDSCDGPN